MMSVDFCRCKEVCSSRQQGLCSNAHRDVYTAPFHAARNLLQEVSCSHRHTPLDRCCSTFFTAAAAAAASCHIKAFGV
jgi:hypothetical protein